MKTTNTAAFHLSINILGFKTIAVFSIDEDFLALRHNCITLLLAVHFVVGESSIKLQIPHVQRLNLTLRIKPRTQFPT